MSKNIGFIGAQGALGSSILPTLLDSAHTNNCTVLPSVNRHNNVEIAKQSDLLLLAIESKDVDCLANEIRKHIKSTAYICSFGAYGTKDDLTNIFGRPVSRMMIDPWCTMSSLSINFSIPNWIHNTLMSMSLLNDYYPGDEEGLDYFTIDMCIFWVSRLMHALGDIDSTEHAEYIALKYRYKYEKIVENRPIHDAKTMLDTISTKGGISERIQEILIHNQDISPQDLRRIVIEELRN